MLFRHLLVTFLLLLSTTLTARENPCALQHCLAVVDAGSTGSRLHVYVYDLDKTNTPVGIRSILEKKVTPGLANVELNARSIHTYLGTLFAEAPPAPMPLYFYATAGMRLLPMSKQKMYYQVISDWFSAQKKWQLAKIKTITGKEEALLDWLAVNYHEGTLNSSNAVGVIDIGGASVQVVFPMQNKESFNDKDTIEIALYGKKSTLSVHSFLGLGQIEMSHQFLNTADCFARNYPLPDGEPGYGNASVCETEVASLMNAVHGVNKTIQPLLAQNPITTWYAMGGIANLAENRLFDFKKNELTPAALLEQADRQICGNVWEDLDKAFPNNDYVYQYCLFSAYYFALLVDGYGLLPDQAVHYIPTKTNLDWTLGVVLYH